MLRQPKKDRMYSVEIFKGPSEAMVYATNPKDAAVQVLRRAGYDVNRQSIVSSDIPGLKPVRICLLGGPRESVTWYGIAGFKPGDPMWGQ